jgi:Bacterial Ig domain
VNDAPFAVGDFFEVNEDTILTANLLVNDFDVDGDPLTATLVSGPAHGAVTLSFDGSFAYTPGLDFNGTDSFTYRANDGTADSNTATVTIVVLPQS